MAEIFYTVPAATIDSLITEIDEALNPSVEFTADPQAIIVSMMKIAEARLKYIRTQLLKIRHP